jgi:hypothetical protein
MAIALTAISLLAICLPVTAQAEVFTINCFGRGGNGAETRVLYDIDTSNSTAINLHTGVTTRADIDARRITIYFNGNPFWMLDRNTTFLHLYSNGRWTHPLGDDSPIVCQKEAGKI